MPSSPVQQLNTIAELIRLTDPESMLDVGVGLGKYGLSPGSTWSFRVEDCNVANGNGRSMA